MILESWLQRILMACGVFAVLMAIHKWGLVARIEDATITGTAELIAIP